MQKKLAIICDSGNQFTSKDFNELFGLLEFGQSSAGQRQVQLEQCGCKSLARAATLKISSTVVKEMRVQYIRAFATAAARKTFRGAAFAVFGQNDKIFMKMSK